MLIISRSPEEGARRDWATLAVMCLVGAAVYVPLWYTLMKVTQPETARHDETSPPISRAAAIYGGRRVGEAAEGSKSGPGGTRPDDEAS
jgi:hypothetical protein